MAAVPEPGQSPTEALDELYELKTLHYGTSTYPSSSSARCGAVNRRADALPAEIVRKARELDRRGKGLGFRV